MLTKRWIRHCVFWGACILALTVYLTGSSYGRLFNTLLLLISGMPVVILYSYLSLYYVIPGTLKSGNYLLLTIYFILGGFAFAVLYRIDLSLIYYRYVEPAEFDTSGYLKFPGIANSIIWINVPFLMFASAKILRDYLLELTRKNEMETGNSEAELSLLAAQLHPHFLFNTLNNLYSLSVTGSPKTAIGLQKISGLMKYILYECSKPEICLSVEISLIDNYIELEKLRYDKRLKVNFMHASANPEFRIAPMILFTFVENCFKHGSSKASGSSFINIIITADEEKLLFTAENSVPEGLPPSPESNKGIGLDNVNKRLDFLYPGRHELEITRKPDRFTVKLEIKKTNV
jgi:two-component system, LytTR family, sensor kinase